jgi:ribosomal protein S18 acetylase RimI-like enzyme
MNEASHYQIRPFRDVDADAVLQLIAELQDAVTPLDESLPRGADMAPRYYAQTMEACRQEAGAIFVAEIDGDVVGFVVVLTRVPFTSADGPSGEYAFITDLAVSAPWRHQGIGARLLSTAEDAARRNGAREIRLEVLVGNPALDLYRRVGLRDYAVTMRKRFNVL